MQQKMLRTSLATNLQRLRLLQGRAAVCSGPFVRFSGSVLAAASHRFAIGDHDFLPDGKPPQIRCGGMHFARVPRAYWRRLPQLLKAIGPNAVCAYMFWNYHVWREGRYE
ncbi:beta-galactosidase [Massilia rhizosphaerae]|uniref:beta-galactosidase n=1 Tax=Massilia rhizosphaerae TaxID=2784389 RepID=UPI001E4A550A|nr:beta-galactosidase [Massilia rhizosphaerae]